MITLVLIGGDSERFKAAGLTTPKALLPLPAGAGAFTLLEAVIGSLEPSGPIVVSGRADMRGDWDWPSHWRGQPLRYVWGNGPARGPLAGVADAGTVLMRAGESLLVSYCDVIYPRGVAHILRHWGNCDSGAVVFQSADPRFGYWHAGRVWEKQVESNWAVSGLFYFRSATECVRLALQRGVVGAGLPALLDGRTKLYRAKHLDLLDLGTPQDYLRFMAEGVRV